MAQITLNSTGVASSGALVLQSNGTTTAVTVSTGQVATFANDAVVNGLTVGRGAGAVSTNTAVGASALVANTTGSGNSAFGLNTLAATTTGNNNTAIGRSVLFLNTGSSNTAVGYVAMYNNTTGNNNTAVGDNALVSNTTASNNTAVGYQAGYSGTTANNNSLFGYQAGYTATTGDTRLTAVGAQALYLNTTGVESVAVGRLALRSNTTGASSVAVGHEALYSNTTASNNTAVGYQAGYSNTVGASCTFLGTQAGYLTTGGSNTFLGVAAGYEITTGTKNTIVGRYDGNEGGLDIRTASNYIVLSDGDGNPRQIIDSSGNLLVGTTSNAALQNNNSLVVRAVGDTIQNHANGTSSGAGYLFFGYNAGAIGSITQSGTTAVLYNTTSDQRLKENIKDSDSASNLIDSLKVRQFDWKFDNSHQRYGFVAQELVTVAPEAVHQPEDTEQMMAVDYSKLVPMLVKAIQELKAEFDAYKTTHP